MSVNVAKIREYNKEVQQYQKKANELLASTDFQKKELLKICTELSEELGQPVTPENLEAVYKQYMAQFEQTIQTGQEIINRVKAEENALVNSNVSVKESTESVSPISSQSGAFMGQGAMPGMMGTGNQMGGPFGTQNMSFPSGIFQNGNNDAFNYDGNNKVEQI